MFFLLIHNALEDFSVQKNFLRPKVYEVAIVFTHCYKTRLHAQKNHIVRKSMKKSHYEHFYNLLPSLRNLNFGAKMHCNETYAKIQTVFIFSLLQW